MRVCLINGEGGSTIRQMLMPCHHQGEGLCLIVVDIDVQLCLARHLHYCALLSYRRPEPISYVSDEIRVE